MIWQKHFWLVNTVTYTKKYMFGIYTYDSHMVSKYFEISYDETNKCILVVSGTFSPTLLPPSPVRRGEGLKLEFNQL